MLRSDFDFVSFSAFTLFLTVHSAVRQILQVFALRATAGLLDTPAALYF
jgi:hypothetical protein